MKLSERAVDAIVQEYGLSNRSRDYLLAALSGKSLAETSLELCVTYATAKNFLCILHPKVGVENRNQLAALIIRKMDELS